jgi:23S rRNA pseudouridine1911/1915/1917 synthase
VRLSCVAARKAALSSILRRELGLSAGLVSRLKWQNALFVNGVPAHTNAPVLPGDTVSAEIAEQAEGFPAQELPLSVLYEDDAVIALDKPAGTLVHPSRCRNDGTLANALLYYYGQTGQRCGVHPVTRLDRDTLGVTLFAKNAFVQEKFRRLLEARELHKTYLAAVFGGPANDAGTIDLPVWKPPGGTLVRQVDPRGQQAVTEYRVLLRENGACLLALTPKTGRTHQLRLHCLASGFPILGDPQYHTPASAAFSASLGLTSQQLLAKTLEFSHPLTGQNIKISSRQEIFLEKG